MKGYIQHLHAFRGFAILNIVGAHAWSFMIFWTGGMDSKGLEWLFHLTESVFHGETLYFAIISGVLFSQVLAERGWRAFYQSKMLNVLLPYIFVTILMTAAYWQYYLENAQQSGQNITFWGSVGANIVAGTGSIQFWYIPVLFVLFAITPLLSLIQRNWPWLMWGVMAVPLVISRSTFPDFLAVQTFVYFIGAYALGIFLGEHYKTIMEHVKQHIGALVTLAILVTLTIGLQYVWQYQPDGFYSSRQSLVYVQKVLVCLLVLHWLKACENEQTLPNWLMTLGTYAFSIYFLHVLYIGFLIINIQPLIDGYRTVEVISALGLANYIVGIAGSLLTAWIVKKLMGRHARKLLGA